MRKVDFNLLDAFKVFDYRAKGQVCTEDVRKSLEQYYGYTEDKVRW